MTAEHTDGQAAKAMDRTDDAATKNVGFHQAPHVSKCRVPGWVLRLIGDRVN